MPKWPGIGNDVPARASSVVEPLPLELVRERMPEPGESGRLTLEIADQQVAYSRTTTVSGAESAAEVTELPA
jgi:hypothetical protein